MERTKVESEAIKSVGYNPETLILEIEFHDESDYLYFRVPPWEYESLMHAPLMRNLGGAYFQEHIRDAYHCKKIR